MTCERFGKAIVIMNTNRKIAMRCRGGPEAGEVMYARLLAVLSMRGVVVGEEGSGARFGLFRVAALSPCPPPLFCARAPKPIAPVCPFPFVLWRVVTTEAMCAGDG